MDDPRLPDQEQKAHIVHLSEPAWKVIPVASGNEFVLGTASGKHFQGLGHAKPELASDPA